MPSSKDKVNKIWTDSAAQGKKKADVLKLKENKIALVGSLQKEKRKKNAVGTPRK